MKLLSRIFHRDVPPELVGQLEPDERVIAAAQTPSGQLVATSLGLWLPNRRRVGWHLISKAKWEAGALTVIEAIEDHTAAGTEGDAILIRDLPPQRYALSNPGKLPDAIHQRVTATVVSRHQLGNSWIVQRKVPGRVGVVLQVRLGDPADTQALTVAAQVAAKLKTSRQKPSLPEG